jgi:hypothetical protein
MTAWERQMLPGLLQILQQEQYHRAQCSQPRLCPWEHCQQLLERQVLALRN